MIYSMTESIFAFCDSFTSQKNISVNKWLLKFEHEMFEYIMNDDRILSNKYLSSLNMLLMNEVARWVESHSNVIRLLEELLSTQQTIENLKVLLCERFSFKIIEMIIILINVELSKLKQKIDEFLISYYKRVSELMQRAETRDKQFTRNSILSSLKFTMLDMILRAFFRELFDLEIKKKVTREMISENRFLRMIYQLAKKARRINLKIQKLYDEELRRDELKFYKNLTQNNLSRHQIEVMFTFYHTNKFKSVHRTSVSWKSHLEFLREYQYQIFTASSSSNLSYLQNSGSYQSILVNKVQYNQISYHSPFVDSASYNSEISAVFSRASSQQSRSSLEENSAKENENFSELANQSGSKSSYRSRLYQSTSKNLPDRTKSKNPWINKSKKYTYDKERLCVTNTIIRKAYLD
jgi:hypothetical protein